MHQLLMEHENTCHRTCFSVRLGGVPLDSHTKISSIQGVQEGAVIKMEEGNYFLFYFFFLLLEVIIHSISSVFM